MYKLATTAAMGIAIFLGATAQASAYPTQAPYGPYDTFEACDHDRADAEAHINGIVQPCQLGGYGFPGQDADKYYYWVLWN